VWARSGPDLPRQLGTGDRDLALKMESGSLASLRQSVVNNQLCHRRMCSAAIPRRSRLSLHVVHLNVRRQMIRKMRTVVMIHLDHAREMGVRMSAATRLQCLPALNGRMTALRRRRRRKRGAEPAVTAGTPRAQNCSSENPRSYPSEVRFLRSRDVRVLVVVVFVRIFGTDPFRYVVGPRHIS
jgi:hypothetical protein